MTAATLERALASLGVPCAVEAEQRLAILRPKVQGSSFAKPAVRARIVALDLADVHTTGEGERAGAVVSGD